MFCKSKLWLLAEFHNSAESVISTQRIIVFPIEGGNIVPFLGNSFRGHGVGIKESSFSSLPSQLGNESTSDLENRSVFSAWFVAKIGYQWDDQRGVHKFENIRRHHSLKHTWGSKRSNSVNSDTALFSLFCKSLSKSVKGELGSRVVDLSKATEKSSSRRSVDNSSKTLFSHDVPGSSAAAVSTVNVNLENEIPILILHFLEWDISQNTRIVQKDVDLAEVVNSSLDDFISKLDRVIVGDCNSTLFLNFLNN